MEYKFFSRTIRISAHDRDSAKYAIETNENFEVDCPSNGGHWARVHGIKIIAVDMPNTAYNVRSLPNGSLPTFKWTDLAGEWSVEVPEGQYTTLALLDYLATAIPAVVGSVFEGQTITYSQNTVTGQVSITSSAGAILTIPSGYYENRIGYLLGGHEHFPERIILGANTFTFPHAPRLYGTPAITVHCPQLGISTVDFDRGSANHFPLVRVPMNVPYNTVAHYQSSDDATNLLVYPSARGISHIAITLRDDRGDIVDINHNDWSIVFKIYYSI